MKFSAACFIAALASSSAAVPLKTPRSSLKPVLNLRGGDTVTNVAAGIIGTAGVASYVFPKENLANYGILDADETALASMRCQGPWQLAFAALTLVEPDKAHAAASLLASAAVLLIIPPSEVFGGPKPVFLGWVGLFAALGVYSLKNEVSPWVITAMCLVNGVQHFFAPKAVYELYKVKKMPSALGTFLVKPQGLSMLSMGIYLGCLAQGLTQAEALAAAWATAAVAMVKLAYTDMAAFNLPKAGPLVWAAISAVIVFLKLK